MKPEEHKFKVGDEVAVISGDRVTKDIVIEVPGTGIVLIDESLCMYQKDGASGAWACSHGVALWPWSTRHEALSKVSGTKWDNLSTEQLRRIAAIIEEGEK